MSLNDQLFGPLGKNFCLYYYFLSVIGFVLLVFIAISTLYIGITKRKDGAFYLQMFMISFVYIMLYFQNRLLHSMCINSLK